MNSINNALKSFKIGKDTPHELADKVNLIKTVVTFTKQYNYGYWLKKVKQSNKSYGQVMEIVKDVGKLDKKYNKGGFITNKLK